MTKKSKRREPPLSVRFTPEERVRLEHAAAGMPLGTYIKLKLFDPSAIPERRRRGSAPVRDQQTLARLMGWLGQSQIARNLALLAEAATSGSLQLDPDTQAMLRQACADIAAIRDILVKALGIRRGDP